MARAQECPRLVKEREARNFVGRSMCATWGHKRANWPQKHVNALSVSVTPSSPPVQSSASCVAPSSVGALTREEIWMMAVQSSILNVKNGESSWLDMGSEEHVCDPNFPKRQYVVSSSERDAEHLSKCNQQLWYEYSGHQTLATKRCCNLLCCSASQKSLEKCSLYWKLIDSENDRLELDSGNCGGSSLVLKAIRGRV